MDAREGGMRLMMGFFPDRDSTLRANQSTNGNKVDVKVGII
jgi:hypothetical protein